MKLLVNKFFILLFLSGIVRFSATAQEAKVREMNLGLGYYLPPNQVPYLKLSAWEKIDRKTIPLQGITASVYLNDEADNHLIEKVKTDKKGESIIYIPAAFQAVWDSLSTLTFLAITDANKDFASTRSEISIAKAKLEIDTSSEDETKNIVVKVTAAEDGQWVPAKEVEVKVAVKRLLGKLPVGEEESYTTDSTGTVTAPFLRDSLYGDENGWLTLIAYTEDNDEFGNISAEKTVKWGVAPKKENLFGKRSLWATRNKTPLWLLALAYSIIAGVWGTLFYLFFQILKIRKLGKAA